MSRMSRRAFMSGAVTGGAALGAAAVGAPGLVAAATKALPEGQHGPLPEGPVVAVVRDPRAGELAVVVGDREVAVKDAKLVRRIVDAAS